MVYNSCNKLAKLIAKLLVIISKFVILFATYFTIVANAL